MCCYLSKGHGWLPGKEESCEVGFHLVFLLCVLLHLGEKTQINTYCANQTQAAKSGGHTHANIPTYFWFGKSGSVYI